MDLPLYLLCLGLLLFTALLWLVFRRRQLRKNPQASGKMTFLAITAACILLMISLFFDFRIKSLENQIELFNRKWTAVMQQSPMVPNSQIKPAPYQNAHIRKAFNDSLQITEQWLNEALFLSIIKRDAEPKAAAFLLYADLSHPMLEVCITPKFEEKYLTSTFAKNNDCDVAINGEAGRSMFPGSGLGEWTGNWVANGKPVLMQDSKLRPFLAFDKHNKATYVAAPIVDTLPSPDKYNAIWGRFDILLNGKIMPEKRVRAYSRTVMGIDETGTKLFLLVVDGKRPQYSVGLSYTECAKLLKAAGATHAMACDQGGSSCMYLKRYKGIINRPADSDGLERPVYSHFGLRLKP